MQQATVSVPASSANLGPGFDCLGVALTLRNRVTITRGGKAPRNPMVKEASEAFFRQSGRTAFDFQWTIEGDIPPSRGLGSSVAVRLGVLHALNSLEGSPLDDDALYRLCAKLEGHPDNAAAAAFGGFTAARPDGTCFRCEVGPELHFVLLVPDTEIETDVSRAKLPDRIAHADAVHSAANAALITAAFVSRQYGLLRGSVQDWLHEPYREIANPHLRPVVAAGVAAGALGGYLSGSGSSVCCVTLDDPERVAGAMQKAFASARTLVLAAANEGVRVTI